MPILNYSGLDEDEDIREQFAELAKLLNFILNGGLDELNIKRITAEQIFTGTLDAGKVTIKVDYATGASITLDSNGMTINDGTKDTFRVDIDGHVTMTGAQVQSANGVYPRVEMSSTNKLFGAYTSVDKSIEIRADDGGQPILQFSNGPFVQGQISPLGVGTMIAINTIVGKGNISISSGEGLDLFCQSGYQVRTNSWSTLKNNNTGRTLQQDLDQKQNTISGYSGSFSTGTKTVFVDNGIITSVV